ncbi:hypothetical protein Y032_0173g417 [Ancylostoma ceylanicum]|uniref:Uncharacterized protein n=1 Tax=Ancylostoma ceylanicum TaxID=53326 RepID=A0A016SV77_9BILA|nr:hypothetical protein Y032_0173g417 [Ancylostoma ceylanicum]
MSSYASQRPHAAPIQRSQREQYDGTTSKATPITKRSCDTRCGELGLPLSTQHLATIHFPLQKKHESKGAQMSGVAAMRQECFILRS